VTNQAMKWLRHGCNQREIEFDSVALRVALPPNGSDHNAWFEPRKIYHHSLLWDGKGWVDETELPSHPHALMHACSMYVTYIEGKTESCILITDGVVLQIKIRNLNQMRTHTPKGLLITWFGRWNHRLDLCTERGATTLRNFLISLSEFQASFDSGLQALEQARR
jgi:hypothetical protein